MANIDYNIKVLGEVTFFRGLSPDDLRGLGATVLHKEFKRDTVLFEHGELGNSLFIVGSGKVKVISPGGVTFVAGDPRRGPDLMSELTTMGAVFGEMAFVDQQPRSAGAVVSKGSALLELTRSDFNRVAMANSRASLILMMGLAGLVSSHLRQTNAEISFLRNFIAQRFGIAIDTMDPSAGGAH